MTGFENAANVAEETIDPSRTFPRALVRGLLAIGAALYAAEYLFGSPQKEI